MCIQQKCSNNEGRNGRVYWILLALKKPACFITGVAIVTGVTNGHGLDGEVFKYIFSTQWIILYLIHSYRRD